MAKPNMAIRQFPKKQNLANKMITAEENGVYAVASEVPGISYAYNDGCIAIATNDGWVKMTCETAEKVAEEFSGILEDIRSLRRMQCQE